MSKKGNALIALAGFGLGVFVGKGLADFRNCWHDRRARDCCRNDGDAGRTCARC